MLNFDLLDMRYQPYPIGAIRPALADDVYAECLSAFPDAELFEYIGDVGHKFSLSEKYAAKNYKRLIKREPIWQALHSWVKSRDFLESTFAALRQRGLDLGYEVPSASRRLQRRIKNLRRGRGRRYERYSARFEFSMLPAAGGSVIPHTDNPEKVVTIVIAMVGEDEWSTDYGGGTDVLRPYDEKLSFERLNKRRPAGKEFEILHTFPFLPNQAVVFTKTFNSWHGVRPMTGPGGPLMRRSLTINIEAS
jgi:hypothetical protein